jgi:hypothetical protein
MFSNAERDSITIVSDRMYRHDILCINYTTYDMRRAQDSINVRKSPYIMALAHEDDEEANGHPYWYAKVLRVFHVKVRMMGELDTRKIDILWVHWFGRDPDHQGGFNTRRLHRVGLLDASEPTSYGFLDPSDVLRAVHLIPAFSTGRIPSEGADSERDATKWEFYYVSM